MAPLGVGTGRGPIVGLSTHAARAYAFASALVIASALWILPAQAEFEKTKPFPALDEFRIGDAETVGLTNAHKQQHDTHQDDNGIAHQVSDLGAHQNQKRDGHKTYPENYFRQAFRALIATRPLLTLATKITELTRVPVAQPLLQRELKANRIAIALRIAFRASNAHDV